MNAYCRCYVTKENWRIHVTMKYVLLYPVLLLLFSSVPATLLFDTFAKCCLFLTHMTIILKLSFLVLK